MPETTSPPHAGPDRDVKILRPRASKTTARGRAAPKRAKAAPKLAKVGRGELLTLIDFVRYAVSRFTEAKLAFAHGTTDPVAEAVFLVCETLHLHPDQFEIFAHACVTSAEGKTILDLI